MAQPALDVFRSLDQALAAAVAGAAPSVLHVSRGRGGGTGTAWSPELGESSSAQSAGQPVVGLPAAAGGLGLRAPTGTGGGPGTEGALGGATRGSRAPAMQRSGGGVAG